jgi:hypothetical protein
MTGVTLPQHGGFGTDSVKSFSNLITTNRLRVIPNVQIRIDPVRVFEALSSAGEIQQIDFSSTQMDSVVSVTYFDLRSARRALMDLRSDFNLLEPDSSYDSSSARSVRIARDSTVSLDGAMEALSKYGEIERLSFVGPDHLLVEFFDTRSPIAVMAALSCVSDESKLVADIGGEARRARYSDPPVVKVVSIPVHQADEQQSQISITTSRPAPSCYGGTDTTEFEVDPVNLLSGNERRTTLMIRNIPNKYSQKVLMKLIDSKFRDKYDFFYLPIDYKNKCNVGYAFINFNEGTSESMIEFYGLFNNKKWEKFNSEKICKITFARLQGQDALIDHFRSSSVMQQHKQLRPFFVKHTNHIINTTPSTTADHGGIQSPPPGLQLVSMCDGESFIGSETGSQVSTALGANGSKNPNTVEGSINLSLIDS